LHCYSYVLAAVIQNSPDGDKCDDMSLTCNCIYLSLQLQVCLQFI